MRQEIIRKKIRGDLVISEKYKYDNIICEYEYDKFSNIGMKGSVNVEWVQKEVLEEFPNGLKCEFNSDYGTKLVGKIRSLPIGPGTIEIDIERIEEMNLYSNKNPTVVEIFFKVPYLKPFDKGIRTNRPTKSISLSSNHKDEFKIDYLGTKIFFHEDVKVIRSQSPDFVMQPIISPMIKFRINKNFVLNDVLGNYYILINDLMLILSVIIFKRISSFGYNVYAYRSKNIVYDFMTMDSKKKIVDEYNQNLGYKCKGFLNEKNISILLSNYLSFEEKKQTRLKRILYSYVSISENKLLEPKFRDTYYLLSAVSKLITGSEKALKDEEYITKGCEIAEIDLKEINFEISPNRLKKQNSKCEWLITEYRHELTHYNFIPYDNKKIYVEFKKMTKLLRKLIFFYIEPTLRDFPNPET